MLKNEIKLEIIYHKFDIEIGQNWSNTFGVSKRHTRLFGKHCMIGCASLLRISNVLNIVDMLLFYSNLILERKRKKERKRKQNRTNQKFIFISPSSWNHKFVTIFNQSFTCFITHNRILSFKMCCQRHSSSMMTSSRADSSGNNGRTSKHSFFYHSK